MKYFIISGSPVYGFRYIGPFDGYKEAVDYRFANSQTISTTWWVAELLTPVKQQETPAK